MKNLQRILLFFFALTILSSCAKRSASDKIDTVKIPAWTQGFPLYEVYLRYYTPEGTFKAFESKLPELKEYGINNIWLMPIHPIGELGRKGSAGCPYSVKDYFSVNPDCGSMDDFDDLIKTAHSLEMKVIIDMVLNHCANDHIEMVNHPGWYAQDSLGNFTREVADWSDVTDWNFHNPETQSYLDSVLIFWVKEHKIDGFRCDVAGMIPDEFWEKIIPELKKINPDLFMLAEWETANMYTAGFQSTYDWTLYHTMNIFLNGKADIGGLWKAIIRIEKDYPKGAMPLRFVENHDQARSKQFFGEQDYRLYAALIFTLPGIPLLYSGQEIGDTVKLSLFEKGFINWREGDTLSLQFYKAMLNLRNREKILRLGELSKVEIPADSILCYSRTLGKKSILVMLNFSHNDQYIKLPDEVFEHTYMWQVLYSFPAADSDTIDTQQTMLMKPKSLLILKTLEGK